MRRLVKRLSSDDSDDKIAAINAIVQASPESALPVLKALAEERSTLPAITC